MCSVSYYLSFSLGDTCILFTESEPVLSSDWTAETRLQLLQSALHASSSLQLQNTKTDIFDLLT